MESKKEVGTPVAKKKRMSTMQKIFSNQDVDEMTSSLMIDLFKRKILEGKQDLQQLRGTWEEASELLQIHFGKLSRIMVENQGKLHRLYQDSIAELKKG